jgi:hypothetical protein
MADDATTCKQLLGQALIAVGYKPLRDAQAQA